jgi:hypothetical protein
MNLDAELELARAGYVRSAKLSKQLERYVAAAQALLGPNDVLLRPTQPVPEGRRVGRAWCPTPLAIAALCAAGVEPEPHPTEDVLRAANHRRFSFDLGGGPPGSEYVRTRSELERSVSRSSRDWLVKRPLSFAGRGQLRLRGGDISAVQWSWIDASLRADGLLVEPRVTPTCEFALHGFIQSDGRLELGLPCVQLVSARGVWKQTELATPGELCPAERRELLRYAESVTDALRRIGYFGPFGIDAYRYELDGRSGFCPLGEINARYTMGFPVGFPRPAHDLSLTAPSKPKS